VSVARETLVDEAEQLALFERLIDAARLAEQRDAGEQRDSGEQRTPVPTPSEVLRMTGERPRPGSWSQLASAATPWTSG